jgi:hypothetical protein
MKFNIRNVIIILFVLYWSKIPFVPKDVQNWAGEYDYTTESMNTKVDKEIERYRGYGSPSSLAWVENESEDYRARQQSKLAWEHKYMPDCYNKKSGWITALLGLGIIALLGRKK